MLKEIAHCRNEVVNLLKQRTMYDAVDENPNWLSTKLIEEADELKDAISSNNTERIMEEMGDVLHTLSVMLYVFNLSEDELLQKTITKFEKRFELYKHYVLAGKSNKYAYYLAKLEV